MQRIFWKALTTVAAMAAAWVARNVSTKVWAGMSDNEAPVNPADRSISWPAALGWAVLAGLTAGVARVLGRRGAAAGWEAATGDAPPGVATA